MTKLSDHIVVDPDIRFGKPTVRGTRIKEYVVRDGDVMLFRCNV